MVKEYFFQEIFGITNPELLKEFCNASSIEYIPKGELLVKEGIFHPNLYFLGEGVLRGFWHNRKGKEATECFIFRYGQPAMGSYRLDDPALVSVLSETDSVIFQMSKEKIADLITASHELSLLYSELLIREMEEQQRIKHTVYMLSAPERYCWFLQEYPNLSGVVSLRHIAPFLNMSPVTLSRIRASMGSE